MRFNKNQTEGVAKVCDNLATAFMVAVMIGGFVDHKTDWITGATLVALFIVLLFAGVILRREGGENGN